MDQRGSRFEVSAVQLLCDDYFRVTSPGEVHFSLDRAAFWAGISDVKRSVCDRPPPAGTRNCWGHSDTASRPGGAKVNTDSGHTWIYWRIQLCVFTPVCVCLVVHDTQASLVSLSVYVCASFVSLSPKQGSVALSKNAWEVGKRTSSSDFCRLNFESWWEALSLFGATQRGGLILV